VAYLENYMEDWWNRADIGDELTLSRHFGCVVVTRVKDGYAENTRKE